MNFLKRSLLVTTSLAVVAGANAAVLFSQPKDNPDGYFSDSMSNGANQFWKQSVADNFFLATASNIDTICFWGSSENFFGPPDLSNFSGWDVVIMSPLGNPVAGGSFAKAAFTITATGFTNTPGGIEYMFELATNINLAAGAYWLHVGSTNIARQDDGWVWSSSNSGDGMSAFDQYDGNGFVNQANGGFNQAFELKGTVVPEPATMAVLGLGAAALLRRRK